MSRSKPVRGCLKFRNQISQLLAPSPSGTVTPRPVRPHLWPCLLSLGPRLMRPVAYLTLHSVTALASHTQHTLAGSGWGGSRLFPLDPLPSLPISGNSTLSIYFRKPVTWGLHDVSLSPPSITPSPRSVDFLPPEYPFPPFLHHHPRPGL